jgi:serine/threonine protein phosphatase 1
MFDWLKSVPRVEPFIPDRQLVYAVGDVHGMIDLLKALVRKILKDASGFPEDRTRIVFLGDFIDRGDHSKAVIDQLIAYSHLTHVDWTFLRGNHEESLLRFLKDPEFGPQWLAFGAAPTFASYGVQLPSNRQDVDAWSSTAEAMAEAIGPSHLAFLESLSTSFCCGSYFFVHAGVRPGVPLAEQSKNDLLWIRGQFLNDRRNLPAIIVHGHSPDAEPFMDHRRIGVDTGAYATGRLTAVRLMGSGAELISVMSPNGRSRHQLGARE